MKTTIKRFLVYAAACLPIPSFADRSTAENLAVREQKPFAASNDLSSPAEERIRVALADEKATKQGETGVDSAARRLPRGLEEVIVTATKRDERLQDVPFGISALATRDLELTGATGQQDYLENVPGVHYTAAGRGRGIIVIRGVSTEGSNLNNLQQTTEVYADDLPLLDRTSVWTRPDIGLFDIDRVEVLRGPQGTLFGSGAMGGIVRSITAKPNLTEFQGKVEATQAFTEGGDDSNSIAGMVNVPLAEDTLALRVVGFYRNDGGWIDNIHRQERNVDGGHEKGGRAILEYAPTKSLRLRLTALTDELIVDDSPKTFADESSGSPDSWHGVLPENGDARLNIYNLSIDYGIGPVSLTSSSTYGVRHSYLTTDFIRLLENVYNTGTDPNSNEAWIKHDSDRFAQEIRLASAGEGPFQWTLGAFYMDHDFDLDQQIYLGEERNTFLNQQIFIETKEKAIFGDITYHLTEKWSATVGARWSTFTTKTQSQNANFGLPFQKSDLDKGTPPSVTTPKVSVSYRPTPDMHLYVTASEGYRIGGGGDPEPTAQCVVEGFPCQYEADSLWNYEAGIKSSYFDNRLSANVAVFHIDWSNIQLQRFVTTSNGLGLNITDNAGKATINGVEAEIAFRPTDAMEIGSSLSYIDAELNSVLSGVPLTPGSVLPGSAKYTASNYIQGEMSFAGSASAYVRLGHHYASRVYGEISNSPVTQSDVYNIFDLRGGVLYGRYEIAAFVDNLANNDAATGRAMIGDVVPYAFRLRPRTVGITFRAGF